MSHDAVLPGNGYDVRRNAYHHKIQEIVNDIFRKAGVDTKSLHQLQPDSAT